MADLSIVGQTFNCGGGSTLGTGLAHCKFDFDNMSGGGVGLLKRGTALPSTFSQATLKALQISGDLIVMQGVVSVENQSSENQRETFESGIEVLATKGLIKYKFDFTNGIMFHKALSKLESFRRYELIVWDGAGNIKARKLNDDYRGFTVGQIETVLPTFKSGGTTAKQSITVQCINRAEFDNNVTFIDADQLDFSMLELDGVNQIDVSFVGVPADGATEATIRVASAFDNSLTVDSLALADLTFTGFTPSALTPVSGTSGNYTLKTPALSTDDVLTASLNGVIDKSDVLYQSNTDTVTVTA